MPRDEREWLPPSEPTSRLWDAFLAGEASGMDGSNDELDPVVAETIRQFHALDDAPAPDAALTERIWQEALVRSGVAGAVPVRANGHGRAADLAKTVTLTTTAKPAAAPARAWGAMVRRWAGLTVREIGIAMLAGAIAGFFVIGGGARLIMRLGAVLADPALQGSLTENGERVGDVTIAGTLGLMVFAAFPGAVGGLLYILFRPWLPWDGWRRGLLFGVLLTLTFGSVALEGGDNPDYRNFGVPFLNVCLFNLLPIGFGMAMAPLVDRLGRVVPRDFNAATVPRRIGRVLAFGGLVLLVLPLGLTFGAGVVHVDPVVLGVVAILLARWGLARWVGRFERPSDLLVRPVAFAAAYAVLLLPVGVGLALTLRAAERILNG